LVLIDNFESNIVHMMKVKAILQSNFLYLIGAIIGPFQVSFIGNILAAFQALAASLPAPSTAQPILP